MLAYLPEGHRVGVINVAVGGIKIEGFMKDSVESYINKQAPDWMRQIFAVYQDRPYDRLIEAARRAQQDGVIKGILFHQGESNTGDVQWPGKVKVVYESLLKDLNLKPENTPLIVGEVVHADVGGICAEANPMIDTLPRVIPTAHVISSRVIPCGPDNLHFNAAGYREFGRRYAFEMLKIMGIDARQVSLDRDGYLGAFSGAIFLRPGEDCTKIYDGAFADAAKFNKDVHVLFWKYQRGQPLN